MEADRQIGLDRDAFDLAVRRVDPRCDVAGDDRCPAAVDRLDRRVDRAARGALEAGAEDRVNQRSGAGERVVEIRRIGLARVRKALQVGGRVVRQLGVRRQQERLDLEAGLGEAARRDQPVAAVVALPADDPYRALG